MIRHFETRNLKYSSEQMFDLVADIEAYPKFIPWCNDVKITSRLADQNKGCEVLEANMGVSFKIISERFSSRVFLNPISKEILVEYIAGPFKFLSNRWTFTSSADGSIVNFHVEFEFKSKLMQRLIGVVFNEAMRRIILSFEKRADQLYLKTK